MASRASLIQSRSIYIGTANNVAPSDGNLIVTGNVGIGTTAPNAKLHVWNGGIKTTGFPSAGNPFTFLESNYNDAAVTVKFLNINPSNGLDADLGIQLMNAAGAMSDVFTIKGSSGNVGIGTTAPGYKLDVFGASNTDAFVRVIGGAGATKGGYVFGNNDGTKDYGKIYFDNSNNNIYFFQYYNAGDIIFGANSTERMRMTNAGNFGIGTTNPTEKLDVAGSGKIQGNLFLTAADPYIEGSGSGAMRIKHTAGQVMYIRPDQTGNVVFFEGASGQTVYLNTATPSVNSTQNSSSALTFEARARNAGGTLNIKSTSLQNTVYDISSNLSRFSITGQDVLYLEGNVGIGTTAPSTKLHVAGNGRFEGNVGIGHGSAAEYFLEIGQGRTGNGFAYIDLIGDATYTDYGLRIIRNNSGANTPSSINHRGLGTFSLNAEDAAPIAFLTSSSERMRITSDGNVGIGTTAPQQLIHVLGATNGYAMIQGASDSGQAGIYFKKEDTTGTMNRTKGLIVFHTNVGSGWGRGHLGFCLNSAESNTVVSVSDEKFRMVDNGDFLADGDVVAYSTTISDARYKTNIQPIESALDKVNQMRGVSFDWTAVRSGREFGVIAQEIEQIAPEVVSDKELLNGDTMKTVSYTSLVPFLIESIKELTQQVNELKAKLDGLTK